MVLEGLKGLGLRYPPPIGEQGLLRDSSAGIWVPGPTGKVVKGWSLLQDYCNHHLFLSHSSLFLCVHFGYTV